MEKVLSFVAFIISLLAVSFAICLFLDATLPEYEKAGCIKHQGWAEEYPAYWAEPWRVELCEEYDIYLPSKDEKNGR